VWAQPIYYDYGTSGNVVYGSDENVYINDQPVASADEYAQTAAELATVEPPQSEDQAKGEDWMPLGTFALTESEKPDDTQLKNARVLQVAVSKSGIVAGTLYDPVGDTTSDVQGAVDKETQRVAMRISSNLSVVAETGLFNLTEQQTPLLMHLENGTRTATWFLSRLEYDATTQQ
jgi:hypothetical protein